MTKEEVLNKYIKADEVFYVHEKELIYAAMEEYREQRLRVSVEDGLPNGEALCLGSQEGEMLIGFVAKTNRGCFMCESDGESLENVTHWMLLPEPPIKKPSSTQF